MSILKIPGYFYFGSETIQGSLNFYKSSKLLQKCVDGIDYTVSGSALNSISNPRVYINNYLGEDLLSFNKMSINIAFTTGQDLGAWAAKLAELFQISPITRMRPANDTNVPTKFNTLNSFEISNPTYITCGKKVMNNFYSLATSAFHGEYIDLHDNGTNCTVSCQFQIFPDDLFIDNLINPDLPTPYVIRVTVTYAVNGADFTLSGITIKSLQQGFDPKDFLTGFNLANSGATDEDTDNPYNDGDDGNNGGDGDQDPPVNQPTDFPELPSISAASLGLISIYTPSEAQIMSLSNYLWSGAFDPDTFKKLFSDPMDAIIGLGIVPAVPSSAGSKNVKFGNIDSGISMPYVSTQWVSVDCGSIKISKKIGSFLDYDPYTKISLYLPFIGFRDISADDVMGGSISIKYNIDILTGSCSAFVKHNTRGVLYNYNGNCIMNVPLSAANYSGAIQNAVSTVASGVGVLAGMASGAAPVTAMSAISMLTSAANTAMNSKPNIQRTGNLGGAAGLLSVKKPFVVIQRPNKSIPNYIQNYVGNVSNKTASLGTCSGFTMVDYVHLDGISATPGEISEIETLLKQGVIL